MQGREVLRDDAPHRRLFPPGFVPMAYVAALELATAAPLLEPVTASTTALVAKPPPGATSLVVTIADVAATPRHTTVEPLPWPPCGNPGLALTVSRAAAGPRGEAQPMHAFPSSANRATAARSFALLDVTAHALGDPDAATAWAAAADAQAGGRGAPVSISVTQTAAWPPDGHRTGHRTLLVLCWGRTLRTLAPLVDRVLERSGLRVVAAPEAAVVNSPAAGDASPVAAAEESSGDEFEEDSDTDDPWAVRWNPPKRPRAPSEAPAPEAAAAEAFDEAACLAAYLGQRMAATRVVHQPEAAPAVSTADTARAMDFSSSEDDEAPAASAPDVAATGTVSLRDPLSYMRMAVPCRGRRCVHDACFDAASYLQHCTQRAAWNCPMCDAPAYLEDLEVDPVIFDALCTLPPHAFEAGQDQVVIAGRGAQRCWRPADHSPEASDSDDEPLGVRSSTMAAPPPPAPAGHVTVPMSADPETVELSDSD